MSNTRLTGAALSPGIAAGPALVLDAAASVPELKGLPEGQRIEERRTLASAIDSCLRELKTLAEKLRTEAGEEKAEILESHIEILSDEEFQEDFFKRIDEQGYSAAFAVRTAVEAHAKEMEELEDEYFRARGDDFRDIGRRVIDHILRARQGGGDTDKPALLPSRPSIVVSRVLSPSQTVQFHLPNLLGLVVGRGGRNSHAAILARSLGIPAIVVEEGSLGRIENGMELILNLEEGLLLLQPDEAAKKKAEEAKDRQIKRKRRLALLRNEPAITACGRRIGLYANGGNIQDLPGIKEANPDGIGLFRTEFLFMTQDTFPDESTQASYYRRVLTEMGDRPVIIRLLDIGGDKPLPYAPHPQENNPFLGWRGIRFLLDTPDLLCAQLRGLLSASAATGKPVRIMVPMVGRVEEMRAVRELLEKERKEIGGQGILGMMVETPAAAFTVPRYKGLAEFISIGSNDLTQYTLAADRENERLGDLYSEFHPAVLGLMAKACSDAKGAGMEAGICGEFAADPAGAVYLAAMGFDELSMSPSAIGEVKGVIRSIRIDEAQRLLMEALAMKTARETRDHALRFLSEKGLIEE